MTYKEFLENKIDIAPLSGIEIDPSEIKPGIEAPPSTSVLWALRGGRRGIFARFGLGKTVMQLEWCHQLQKARGRANADRDAAERHARISGRRCKLVGDAGAAILPHHG